MQVSSRLGQVPASPIRKLVPLAQVAKAQGKQVYHLNIGDPDIQTPYVILDRLRAYEQNPVGYAHSQGEAGLLEALVGYYRGLGYDFIDKSMVQVTQGGSEALMMALFAVAEAGDEILVPEPFFTGYASIAPLFDITLVPIPLSIDTGFHLPDQQVIEDLITERTKAILYCSPNNPTGTVFDRQEIELLVRLARERNLFLIADEVYREFVFDGREQLSLLDYMRDLPDRIVVLDSLSKRYSVPGFRLGMMVSMNQELMAGVLRMAMGRLSAATVDQVAASALNRVGKEEIWAVRDIYQKRRDVVFDALSGVDGVTIQRPEGAFYAVAGLPHEAEAFCAWLLTDFHDNNETVMLAPMPGFYATPGKGTHEVRIAYVLEVPKLQRAMEILAKAISAFT
jgi:aspartate aminotransferase